eukprot:1101973-Rhodomonas_salina.1
MGEAREERERRGAAQCKYAGEAFHLNLNHFGGGGAGQEIKCGKDTSIWTIFSSSNYDGVGNLVQLPMRNPAAVLVFEVGTNDGSGSKVGDAICLRTCYAMPATDLAYGSRRAPTTADGRRGA